MNSQGILCFQTNPAHLTLVSRFGWKVRRLQMGFGVVEKTTHFATNQTRKCLVMVPNYMLGDKLLKAPIFICT